MFCYLSISNLRFLIAEYPCAEDDMSKIEEPLVHFTAKQQNCTISGEACSRPGIMDTTVPVFSDDVPSGGN